MKTEINVKKDNVKEVKVEMQEKEVKPHYEHALEHFKNDIQTPGFRKGKVPINIVKDKIDKQKLDNVVLNHIYPDIVQNIIKEHKIIPIMNPKIQIEEMSETGVKLTLTFVERPNIKLADYQKIAKNAKNEVKKEESKIITAKNMDEAKKKGQEKIKENTEALNNKGLTEDQKLLSSIYQNLIDKSDINLPEILITEEANRMIQSFLSQLSRLQINLEDYLKQVNITMDKLRENYKAQAIKNLKLEFILSEISKKEEIKVSDKEIQEVIDNVPDENQKKALSTPDQKYYIESTLLKNKVAGKLIEWSK